MMLRGSHTETMKILWICPFFLHPTDRGAQIRTLGIVKELHKRHEIHFVALNDPQNVEGPERSTEYSTRHFAIDHSAPGRRSVRIIPQLVGSVVEAMPLAVSRYYSEIFENKISELIAREHYDSIVCDFLAAAPNLKDMRSCVLFQHNVETTIWQRHAAQNSSYLKRWFFQLQARKMAAYERKICREAKHVIAVSEIDAKRMKSMFDVEDVSSITTGVDVDFFASPSQAPPVSDILFCGSMDWLPNVDAVVYFLAKVLPLIRERKPDVTFTIAGRSPDAAVLKAVEGHTGVYVTGKVPDMRPYLWGSKISVVPIRIGGGTRLKIYECMASGLPVVSTAIGAEGLRYEDGKDIVIADDAERFAAACVRMLTEHPVRDSIARNALELVQDKLSWEAVSREFEAVLEHNRLPQNENMAEI